MYVSPLSSTALASLSSSVIRRSSTLIRPSVVTPPSSRARVPLNKLFSARRLGDATGLVAAVAARAAKSASRVSEGDSSEDESKQPPASGPTKTVKIFCAKCQQQLYRYRKGGNGALVKCFVERIAEDFTAGDMKCPTCGSEFARMRMIKGKPAHKIVGGKVFMRK